MSVQTEERPASAAEIPMFYTLESLRFTRSLLGELEHEIKAKARQLTRDAGRDTVTEDDMRRAADEILGPVEVEANDPGVGNG
jgi:hypothetical protein